MVVGYSWIETKIKKIIVGCLVASITLVNITLYSGTKFDSCLVYLCCLSLIIFCLSLLSLSNVKQEKAWKHEKVNKYKTLRVLRWEKKQFNLQNLQTLAVFLWTFNSPGCTKNWRTQRGWQKTEDRNYERKDLYRAILEYKLIFYSTSSVNLNSKQNGWAS